ncbi:PQQ-dependent sugar dehydrogenase [Cyclobacterium plantarum]|uniref:PQQ-dependent sugar dehydrogenase n=1 Tax=Cyclobacterium plantarum TaxID=2716263 RepID=A0ABX0H9L3_9BACT|nr:PQQ-dependent sugar dehydrogenase [Cyclobacterium plantarum]NHE58590.1 PQQ-dependent sugar dehydrogenase [Cyclobacterium plantarum]
MKIKSQILSIGAGIFLLGCTDAMIVVPEAPFPIADDSFVIDTVATGFTIPYGIAIVGEEEYFITDRIGKMFHLDGNNLTELMGLPAVVTFGVPGLPAILHGGLMDISLHPDYASNGWIYICYLAEDGFAKVSRLTLENHTIDRFETIFITRDQNYTGNGMRIAWQDEGHFFLNVGNSDFSTSTNPIMHAQDLNHDAGKIHRLGEDGGIPSDNPVFDGSTSPTSIWSYGHRDVQGLFYERSSDTLYGLEHGPKGGDEFNIIEKGGNYGWPLFSYGVNYDGAQVSTLSEDSASRFTVLPVHIWTVPTPSGGQALAPSCLLKVSESRISDWNDHFIFGSLAFRRLMKYNPETQETVALNVTGRVRTIKQLPGGDLLALVERNDLRRANGKIIKIRQLPKKEPDDM